MRTLASRLTLLSPRNFLCRRIYAHTIHCQLLSVCGNPSRKTAVAIELCFIAPKVVLRQLADGSNVNRFDERGSQCWQFGEFFCKHAGLESVMGITGHRKYDTGALNWQDAKSMDTGSLRVAGVEERISSAAESSNLCSHG